MSERILIADSVVSFAALCGLMVLVVVVRRQGAGDPLNRRFLFGLLTVACVMAGRLSFWWTGHPVFSVITIIAAGLIPLATLLLTEGLLRRHAPFALKMLVAVGSLAFAVLAFLPDRQVEPGLSYALIAYQLFGFLAAGALVLTRDRSSLSASENRTVERIALALLLIIPFVITDFRAAQLDLPVRLAGIAILFLCWLAIGLSRWQFSHWDSLIAFGVLAVAALLGGLAIAEVAGLTGAGTVQAVAVMLSVSLVAVIYNDARALANEARRDSLLRHLAEGDLSNPVAFLEGLSGHPLVEGALVLDREDLKEFDLALLTEAFEQQPVRRIDEARAEKHVTDETRAGRIADHFALLFQRYEATHFLLASRDPVLVVALNMPLLASSPGAETELKAVQRMAELIAERDRRRV